MKILTDGEDNEIYNISANQEQHNIDVVTTICDYMNAGHDLINFIDIDSIGKHCIDWYLDNKNFLELYGEIIWKKIM